MFKKITAQNATIFKITEFITSIEWVLYFQLSDRCISSLLLASNHAQDMSYYLLLAYTKSKQNVQSNKDQSCLQFYICFSGNFLFLVKRIELVLINSILVILLMTSISIKSVKADALNFLYSERILQAVNYMHTWNSWEFFSMNNRHVPRSLSLQTNKWSESLFPLINWVTKLTSFWSKGQFLLVIPPEKPWLILKHFKDHCLLT